MTPPFFSFLKLFRIVPGYGDAKTNLKNHFGSYKRISIIFENAMN